MASRKRRNIIISSLLSIITVPLLYFIIFMYKTEAPITKGHIEYGVKYNHKQKLDIYYPTNVMFDTPPVLLFIHGGAWMAGRKESININRFNGAINKVRASGYVVISPSYTLATEDKSPFPYCINDVFEAINWIYLNADSLNLDLNNFGIMGESAGAHLSMMATYATPTDFDLPYPKMDVDYLVNVYGPNDLWDLYHMQTIDSLEAVLNRLPASLNERFDLPKLLFGFDPKEDSMRTREFTTKYSPITYIKGDLPPTLFIHGDQDILVPIEQTVALSATYDSLHFPQETHILKGVNHAFFEASDQQKDSVQFWISDFVTRQYNVPVPQ